MKINKRLVIASGLVFVLTFYSCFLKQKGFNQRQAITAVKSAIKYAQENEFDMYSATFAEDYNRTESMETRLMYFKRLGNDSVKILDEKYWKVQDLGFNQGIAKFMVIVVPYIPPNRNDTLYIGFDFDKENKYVRNDKIVSVGVSLGE